MNAGGTIRAVFFDLDDTLFSTTEFAERARRNSIRGMVDRGLRIDPEACLAELHEVISEFSSNYEHHYDRLLARLPKSATEGLNPAVLVAAAVVAYHQTKFEELEPFPEVPEVLAALAASDRLLGVITSGLAVKQAEKLIRLEIIDFFDPRAIFISEQIGIGKPNPKLFTKACAAVGVDPREAVYVGDRPQLDIDPANAVGMTTVRTRRPGGPDRPPGATEPDHTVADLREILAILA